MPLRGALRCATPSAAGTLTGRRAREGVKRRALHRRGGKGGKWGGPGENLESKNADEPMKSDACRSPCRGNGAMTANLHPMSQTSTSGFPSQPPRDRGTGGPGDRGAGRGATGLHDSPQKHNNPRTHPYHTHTPSPPHRLIEPSRVGRVEKGRKGGCAAEGAAESPPRRLAAARHGAPPSRQRGDPACLIPRMTW